jgi:hypothetical protein
MSVQLTIHPFEPLMHDRTLGFTIVWKLLETAVKDRTRILNRTSDCGEQLQFHSPVPHLDLRLFTQVAPKQVGLGMKPLQITANRDLCLQMAASRSSVKRRHPTCFSTS